jgi:hypothetical protein
MALTERIHSDPAILPGRKCFLLREAAALENVYPWWCNFQELPMDFSFWISVDGNMQHNQH